MSEEISASVSLEEPGAAFVGPGQPETPPAEPAAGVPATEPQTPPGEPEPEGVIAAPTGEKYVPLAALQAERGKRKEAEGKVLSEADLQALRDKARGYDESAAWVQQARPYIDAIRSNPDLVKQVQNGGKPVAPQTDERAETYAKRFDLFTPDGKPDVARAQAILQDQDAQMERVAQKAVAPLVQTEAQRTSIGLYQHYLQQPEVNGIKVDPKYLAETWASVPPEVSADPRVAQVLYMNTIGRQILAGHKPAQAPPQVVPTEGVGSGTPSAQALTPTSEKFLAASQMKPAEFRATREQYKPGQPNSLE